MLGPFLVVGHMLFNRFDFRFLGFDLGLSIFDTRTNDEPNEGTAKYEYKDEHFGTLQKYGLVFGS